MNLLFTGPRGAGKSTLLCRLLEAWGLPVSGFITKRIPGDKEDKTYIYPAALPEEMRAGGKDNLLGACASGRLTYSCPETFDSLGVAYLSDSNPGGIIVMDELGFMENEAKIFQQAVFSCLKGERPVAAVIKDKDTPFLNSLRSYPGVRVITVTKENREELYEALKLSPP